MPNPAENFINILTDPNLPPSSGGADYTERLRARDRGAIDQILARSRQPRGVIWFPPGIYPVKTGWTVPETITLSFAPGAVLIPFTPQARAGLDPAAESIGMTGIRFGTAGTVVTVTDTLVAESVLQIAGVVEAEPYEIFATAATVRTLLKSGLPDATVVGRVAFVGDGTRRIVPEWWGASRRGLHAEPAVDTAAVQAAIRAAITDREALTRGTPRPPLTVYLGGSYAIQNEVFVAAWNDALPIHNAVIEGNGTSVSPATLVCADNFPKTPGLLAALLGVARVRHLWLRGVSFDARGTAPHCVAIEFNVAKDLVASQATLDQCTCIDATVAQVSILDASVAEPARGSITVTVRGGRFAALSADRLSSIDSFRNRLVALAFQVAWRATLRVVGATFDGYARRAILSTGGRVQLIGCRFAITDVPDASPFGAADVELSRPPVPEPRFASLDAAACVSTSPSFLSVSRVVGTSPNDDFSVPPEAGQVILTGVTHDANRARGGSGSRAPAVAWKTTLFTEAPSVARGAWLFLNGCTFAQPEETSFITRLPRIFLDAGLARIFNVATFRGTEDLPPLGALRVADPAVARSLGEERSEAGPVPLPFPVLLGDTRLARAAGVVADETLLRAWTNWLPRGG